MVCAAQKNFITACLRKKMTINITLTNGSYIIIILNCCEAHYVHGIVKIKQVIIVFLNLFIFHTKYILIQGACDELLTIP